MGVYARYSLTFHSIRVPVRDAFVLALRGVPVRPRQDALSTRSIGPRCPLGAPLVSTAQQ